MLCVVCYVLCIDRNVCVFCVFQAHFVMCYMLCVVCYVLCTVRHVCISYVLSTYCYVLYVMCCVLCVVHSQTCVYFIGFRHISGNVLVTYNASDLKSGRLAAGLP